MTTVRDEPRTGARMAPRQRGAASREVRVPRLLALGAELSWRFLVCVAAIAVVVFAITKVSFAFIAVVVALLLATLLVPPARWLQRQGAPAGLATAAVFFCALVAVVAMVTLLAPPVSSEFGTLADRIREGADKVGVYLADSPLNLDEREVQREIDRLDDRLTQNSGAITSGVLSGAQMVGQLLAGLLLTLVILFFFVKDGPRLWAWVVGLFPQERREAVRVAGDEAWSVLGAYTRGVVLVAFVDAIGIGLALWLIGVPLILPLAVLTFFAAFIPVIGAWVAGTAAALVALVAGGPVDALLVAGATLLVQQLEGNVLYPMIVGRTLSIHPLVVLLAVTVGGLTAGIVGAAIAVPVAVTAGVMVSVVRRYSEGGEVPVDSTVASDAHSTAVAPR